MHQWSHAGDDCRRVVAHATELVQAVSGDLAADSATQTRYITFQDASALYGVEIPPGGFGRQEYGSGSNFLMDAVRRVLGRTSVQEDVMRTVVTGSEQSYTFDIVRPRGSGDYKMKAYLGTPAPKGQDKERPLRSVTDPELTRKFTEAFLALSHEQNGLLDVRGPYLTAREVKEVSKNAVKSFKNMACILGSTPDRLRIANRGINFRLEDGYHMHIAYICPEESSYEALSYEEAGSSMVTMKIYNRDMNGATLNVRYYDNPNYPSVEAEIERSPRCITNPSSKRPSTEKLYRTDVLLFADLLGELQDKMQYACIGTFDPADDVVGQARLNPPLMIASKYLAWLDVHLQPYAPMPSAGV